VPSGEDDRAREDENWYEKIYIHTNMEYKMIVDNPFWSIILSPKLLIQKSLFSLVLSQQITESSFGDSMNGQQWNNGIITALEEK